MAALIDLAGRQRLERPGWEVPDLDPASGGTQARVLFLLEKPGRQTMRRGGSGFVSLHNDSATAAAIHEFALVRNGLRLDDCLIANAVPWWDGSIAVGPEQRRLAAPSIASLLPLLPRLRAVVLVGATAQAAWDRAALNTPPRATLHRSDHPSPQVRAGYRARWDAIPACWPSRASLDGGA